ncbi:hypothetical protein MalM25_10720 [Planctomycetes bacterium MalM25]|nr:hypothetical protein MalM25_10720 [Planctomycetes bacterium MalM25]
MNVMKLAVLVVATAVSLPAAAENAFDWPEQVDWSPVYVGIEEAAVTLTRPRPLRVHAMRVDLSADGVRVVTDDDNGDRPEETDGLKTSTFLTRKGCQVAINGAPFWPGQKEEDQPQNVVGLVVHEGELVSPLDADKPRAALVFRGGAAAVERAPIELAGIKTAVGGFGVVLEEGQIVRPRTETDSLIDNRHPRTGVGVANGGRTLILVVVDGRQEGDSEGVSLPELGEALRRLGAQEGLNLDGGGTSAMAADSGHGAFRLVNRPIDGGQPGQERVSASHLGVYAKPLP